MGRDCPDWALGSILAGKWGSGGVSGKRSLIFDFRRFAALTIIPIGLFQVFCVKGGFGVSAIPMGQLRHIMNLIGICPYPIASHIVISP